MKARGLHGWISRRRGRSLSVLAIAALAFAAPGVSQAGPQAASRAPATAKAAAPATPKPAEANTADKGLGTGIKVHGHWVIDIRNPDGTQVSHTEFENAYVVYDTNVLGEILIRQSTPGMWGVILGGSASPCTAQIVGVFGSLQSFYGVTLMMPPPYCVISETGPMLTVQNCVTSPPSSCSQSLQIGANASASGGLTLTGSVVATSSGTISQVASVITLCGTGVTSSTCATETTPDSSTVDIVTPFTMATLPAQGSGQCGGANQPSCAIPVSAGQTIGVLVNITFQ